MLSKNRGEKMGTDLVGKEIKVVFNDGDKVSIIFCTVLSIDNRWIELEYKDKSINLMNLNQIIRINILEGKNE